MEQRSTWPLECRSEFARINIPPLCYALHAILSRVWSLVEVLACRLEPERHADLVLWVLFFTHSSNYIMVVLFSLAADQLAGSCAERLFSLHSLGEFRSSRCCWNWNWLSCHLRFPEEPSFPRLHQAKEGPASAANPLLSFFLDIRTAFE
jgi:hypothetical protein